ncbi:MAG: CsiV family protein [Pseudomonadota bacterium]
MFRRTIILPTALALFAGSGAPRALAQNETDQTPYQVEIVLFEHAEPFAAGEVFDLTDRTALAPTEDEQATLLAFGDGAAREQATVATDTDDESPTPRRLASFPAVAEDELTLTETIARIDRASRFNLIGHAAWRQDALPTEEAPAQRIGLGSVRGTVLLSRSRFLRLDIELDFKDGEQPITLRQTRRRVQLGRPHYIDHPLIGAVVQITRRP